MISILLLILFNAVVSENCYWNRKCPHLLHSTKTPYETVRGDIRDYPDPESCEAVSIWSLHRHGNRNPGLNGAVEMKQLIDTVQSQIIDAFEAGRSQMCAQDIEAFRKWTFNETILVSPSYLTGTGYKELYDIAKRLRLRYPHLFQGDPDDYYFRPADSQRNIASAMGYVHGLSDGTGLNITFDGPFERDDMIRPNENCEKYLQEVRGGILLKKQLIEYVKTEEYQAMMQGVQRRLGITYQLTEHDVQTLFEICRYHRTWVPNQQDAWCAVFTDEDLIVLEYRDDVGHHIRNGYGSWVNPRLAGPVLKDLRERFQAAVRGEGKKVVSYFSHNSMTEMSYVALGLYRDNFSIVASKREPSRLWKTNFIAAFATNMMVVLNRCTISGVQSHRVQFFINEKETTLCPLSGCTWEQFEDLVKDFDDNLDFCSLDYPDPEPEVTDSALAVRAGGLVLLQLVIMLITW